MHPSSLPIPCPKPGNNLEERQAEEYLECITEMYNRATWVMYNRILISRRSRRKSMAGQRSYE